MVGGDETEMRFSYVAIQGMYALIIYNRAILLEREIYKSDNSSIKIEDFNKIRLNFGKFEIKTIKSVSQLKRN